MKEDLVSKKERQKIERVNHTLSHLDQTIDDFASRLKLKAKGLDPWKDLAYIVSIDNVVVMFGKRQKNGWKARVSDSLSECNYKALHELYEAMYARTPTNKDFPAIFL